MGFPCTKSKMKRWWNSFKIAFLMYSKIPMPESAWTKENMSYTFVFFPWIGAVIGALTYGLFAVRRWCEYQQIEFAPLTFTVLMVLLPIAITGGIHMDGFMDTQDALKSYEGKERRLEILKDPHAGAFAILSCCVYLLCEIGIYASMGEKSARVIGLSFLMSRTLSGLSVISFPQAKKKGLVATFSENADQKRVWKILCAYQVGLSVILPMVGGFVGLAGLFAAAAVFLYYERMSRKHFGGVTGDLAGYFLQMCEIWMAAAAVFAEVILRYMMG